MPVMLNYTLKNSALLVLPRNSQIRPQGLSVRHTEVKMNMQCSADRETMYSGRGFMLHWRMMSAATEQTCICKKAKYQYTMPFAALHAPNKQKRLQSCRSLCYTCSFQVLESFSLRTSLFCSQALNMPRQALFAQASVFLEHD